MSVEIEVSARVKEALADGKGVVALESTIISHGMPYPKNLETALALEEEVLKKGAVPATIGILQGKPIVGLSEEGIHHLAQHAKGVQKTSRRDIPLVCGLGKNGATTVSSTMFFAQKAGIKVFATGGIGGVHRGASKSFDISADLTELGKTNVAVVCSGVKSILDIGLTLEYLETQGVPVLGFKTEKMPAFYTRESSFFCDAKIESIEDLSDIVSAKWKLGIEGGLVVANPVPAEYSYPAGEIEDIIKTAILELERFNITGKDITPFLLEKIQSVSGGKSLESNIELVKDNARVAADLANSLAKKLREKP
ncbi:MAG: pseudouridine-5'-phosphate glycosidase [Deltaproteobacteria bacterium]|nr:MAG: pseudouridine-5'-phosphate glycosidase [Deltaproteobacteria bacterium]